MNGVPIARTSLLENEIEAVLDPIRSGWLVQGPKVKEFEGKWSAFTGAPHSAAVTSCTSGLHLALSAAGIGLGDEVIVPAFTWISTANVVEHTGATVVFCDIDVSTFNIDTKQLEGLISEKTRAVIPVHLFGLSADMEAVNRIAERHKLFVLEDAACGFGATLNGQHVGFMGDAGVFSFHPRKAITTGEGGMVTSSNGDLMEKIRRLRDHGAEISDLQRHYGPKPYLLADHTEAGYNQRMTDIQAALGSAQMDRAANIVEERRSLAARYGQALSTLSWLGLPEAPEGYEHGYQSYPCLFMPEETIKAIQTCDNYALEKICEMRNAWMDKLQERGVSTRPATHAVHMLSYYKGKYGYEATDFPNAYAANNCSISIPLFHGMTEREREYVVEAIVSESI